MKSFLAPHALRYQKGSYMIWIIILILPLVGIMAFSLNSGKYLDDSSQAQTVADSTALAGINVVRRIFGENTTSMPAVCKAGFISKAVNDALTRMADSVDVGGMGFAVDEIDLIYCPRSSEQLIEGGGPCYVIPSNAVCNIDDCNCGSYVDLITTYVNPDTNGKPAAGYYPLENELAGGVNADSAAYVFVQVTYTPLNYFGGLLPGVNFPQGTVGAMARASMEGEDVPSCPAYYNPHGADNDPQLIRLKDGSSLEITNGGLLLLDDPNNVFSLSGQGNTIEADWVMVRENATINSSIIDALSCTNSSFPCPLKINQDDIEEQWGSSFVPSLPVFTAKSCAAYPDTQGNKCDNPEPGLYINCVIDATNYNTISLIAGTYCGGLTIEDAGTEEDPFVLNPLLSSGEIADDVYYFTGKPSHRDDYRRAPTSTWGGLDITDSYVEAGNAGITGAGIYLYVPTLGSSSDYSIELRTSELYGSARFYVDHLYLDDSRLSFSPYLGAGNSCEPETESIIRTWLVQ